MSFQAERESSDAQQALQTFWQKQIQEMRGLGPMHFKSQELPLARIKKIMKIDDDVRMISSEAPLLFAKAAQIFITELTLRAWIHTEDSKRRTLQRNDIAMAITKFDQVSSRSTDSRSYYMTSVLKIDKNNDFLLRANFFISLLMLV